MSNKNLTMSWDELLDEYFFEKNLRPATEESYRKVVRVFCRFNNDKVAAEITHHDVLKWRRYLLKDKLRSAQTWNNKVAHMRALFNFWIESDLVSLDKNPFHNSNVQRDVKKKKTLNRNQLTQIYLLIQQFEEQENNSSCSGKLKPNALKPVWFWLTVLDTLRYTGMRLNQLLHVRVRDVNLEDGSINLVLDGSKTHREWRVPIVKQLRPRLAYLVEQARYLDATPSSKLFDAGRYIRGKADIRESDPKEMQQKVRSFFRRLSRECDFVISPHRFRHTLATELMQAPERNLQLVKELLGHRSVNTTMEYVEMKMDIVGRTLEEELALHTDRHRVIESRY